RLPLGFEPRHDLSRVHAQFDHLQGDPAAHRLLLLRHIDNATSAVTEFLQEPIMANSVAGFFRQRRGNTYSAFRPSDLRCWIGFLRPLSLDLFILHSTVSTRHFSEPQTQQALGAKSARAIRRNSRPTFFAPFA